MPDTNEQTPSPEMQRLSQLLGDESIVPGPEEAQDYGEKRALSPEEAAAAFENRPTYDRVPYLNDDITFKDREAELTLLLQLLNFRREAAIRELSYVQNCRNQRYYPGIIHQDPAVGAG